MRNLSKLHIRGIITFPAPCLMNKIPSLRVTFISTYPPRKCGIATYTRDLVEQLQKQNNSVEIVALDGNKKERFDYPSIVTATIEKDNRKDYVATAEKINISNTDIVHIQHEYGIFGGSDGEYVLDFARTLRKPFVVTFHTTLKTPSQRQMFIIRELTRLSRGVITMKEIGKDRLTSIYGVNGRDISIIFHGVPDMDHLQKEEMKNKLGFGKRFILMTSNLISSNKGIEYAIQALPTIIKKIPQILLLIVGETHPQVKEKEGEAYREMLQELVKGLGVGNHVQFVNQYLSIDSLKEYFAAADIVITPYFDAEQITSGTLAYAIGAGKVCISTPFIYAKHMLKNNRGILVPFREAKAIASEVLTIYAHPRKKQTLEKRAYTFGKQMRWPKIAKKHTALYESLLQKEQNREKVVMSYIKNPIDITYLSAITNTIGILQHTHESIPDTKFGYSTDDNARALIVVSALYRKNPSQQLLSLLKGYLGFLYFAQEENGKFHTFLSPDNKWLDSETVNDAFGKAVWSLGFFLYSCPDSPFAASANTMFQKTLTHLPSIISIRTIAFVMLGLYYYYTAFEDQKDTADIAYNLLKKLADFLVEKYNQEKQNDWQWFEKTVTYDNFRLPQALFFAYLATKEDKYKTIAEEILSFLLDCNYDKERNFFDFIGQNGWYVKGKKKVDFDQQPLEPAAAVCALTLAYKITRKKIYLDKAIESFAWFFGKNRNHTTMINELTKGIYDGLTTVGVNENQGSESIACFLLAHIDLKEAIKKD